MNESVDHSTNFSHLGVQFGFYGNERSNRLERISLREENRTFSVLFIGFCFFTLYRRFLFGHLILRHPLEFEFQMKVDLKARGKINSVNDSRSKSTDGRREEIFVHFVMSKIRIDDVIGHLLRQIRRENAQTVRRSLKRHIDQRTMSIVQRSSRTYRKGMFENENFEELIRFLHVGKWCS